MSTTTTQAQDIRGPVDEYSSHDTTPRRLGLALLLICTAQLMIVLDSTIVNIALPHLQRDLDFSQANLQWVITIYTLAFGGTLLLGVASVTSTADAACSPSVWRSSPSPRWAVASHRTRR